MTKPTDTEAAKHARRAAALLVHYANNDREGFFTVMNEREDDNDSLGLVLGLCGMFTTALPMLLTPGGISLVQRVVTGLAGMEYGEPPADDVSHLRW